jgi:putative ABC transport system ATP-binding protein
VEQPSNSTVVLLEAKSLGRAVNARILVQDVNFTLRRREVLAITGPSGAGKSSLLRLLNRLDEPTSGTVYFASEDYRKIEPRELRRRVGMVTQRPYLFPGTVAGNLNFGPQQCGETLKRVALEQLLDQVASLAQHGRRLGHSFFTRRERHRNGSDNSHDPQN